MNISQKIPQKKILVVQIGRLGDMVLTTPVFQALRRKYPDAQIHVLASPTNAMLLECCTAVNRVLVFKKSLLHRIAMLARLRLQHYDLWIDPKDEYSRTGALLVRAAKAKQSIGWNATGSAVFSHTIADVVSDTRMQVLQRNLAALSLLGISDDSALPQLCLRQESKDYVQSFLREQGINPNTERLTLVNISAGNDSRRWSEEKWSEVAIHLTNAKHRLLLSCAPEHSARAEEIQRHVPQTVLFTARSIHDINALMQTVGLLISPDTSLIHIAAAFNVPVVGLYPALEWNTNKFRPLSSVYRIVHSDSPQNIHSIGVAAVLHALSTIEEELHP